MSPFRLVILLLAFAVPVTFISSQGLSTESRERLQQVLEDFQNNPSNPYVGGISAAIRIDGLAEWEGVTGFASRNVDAANNLLPGGSAYTTEHVSRAYSVTKTFTAALVLELVQEGTLGLDQKVADFLPLHLINNQLNGNVTLAQLLAHESGYSDFLTDLSFQIAVAFQPTREWTAFETVSFATQENAPGSVRKYSSTNYILLGAIIEAATARSLQTHFRDRFFDPLELRSMYLAGREAAKGFLTAPHDNISALNPIFSLTGQPIFPNSFTNISAFPFTAIQSVAFSSGGVVSSTRDLARWGDALFGGKATSEQTLKLMLQSIAATPDEDGDFLGYGIWRTTKISATDVFIGHDGSATGYRSVLFYQPDKKLTISIMTNYAGANLYEVARALYAAFPDFTCGNKKEDKIIVCWNGKQHCVARSAAEELVRKGAWLGDCGNDVSADLKNPKAGLLQEAYLNGLAAFPNPFQNATTVSFLSHESGRAKLELVDVNGRIVGNLFDGWVEANSRRQVRLDAGALQDGVYLLRMITPQGVRQKKLVLMQ